MAQPATNLVAFRRDIIRTRRLLRRLPDSVNAEIIKVYEQVGPQIEAYGKANVPVKTGRLRNALRFRILPKSLRAQFGLIGRRLNRDLFYGYILEAGRKAGPAKHTTQRRLKGGGLSKKYRVNVRGISPGKYDFVQGRAKTYAKQLLRPLLAKVFERALKNVAGG
jgi:hypothetical protein